MFDAILTLGFSGSHYGNATRAEEFDQRDQKKLAEGEGFEPTIRLPVYTLSRRAPSATRPPLRRRLRRGRLRCEAPKAGSAGTRLDVARCLRRKGSGPSSVAGRHLASGAQIRKAPGGAPPAPPGARGLACPCVACRMPLGRSPSCRRARTNRCSASLPAFSA